MLCMVIYVPFFRTLFGVFCLNMNDWIIIIILAFSVSPVLEFFKWLDFPLNTSILFTHHFTLSPTLQNLEGK